MRLDFPELEVIARDISDRLDFNLYLVNKLWFLRLCNVEDLELL
jgi:hypothetical protein